MAKKLTINRTLSVVFVVSVISYLLSLYEFLPVIYWLKGNRVEGRVSGYSIAGMSSKVINPAAGTREAIIDYNDGLGGTMDYRGVDLPILPFHEYTLESNVHIVYPKDSPEKARLIGIETVARCLYFFILGQMAWSTFSKKYDI